MPGPGAPAMRQKLTHKSKKRHCQNKPTRDEKQQPFNQFSISRMDTITKRTHPTAKIYTSTPITHKNTPKLRTHSGSGRSGRHHRGTRGTNTGTGRPHHGRPSHAHPAHAHSRGRRRHADRSARRWAHHTSCVREGRRCCKRTRIRGCTFEFAI